MDYYNLKICGLTRRLPLIKVGKNTSLAAFSILGDVELVDKLADTMAEKLKEIKFDVLVGPEVKVVPLIHGVAKRLGHKKFVICRKSVKPYMISPVILKPLSFFPKHTKPLVLNGEDAKFLKGKKIVIMDDVISTGVTIRMMKKMMEKVEAQVVAVFTALKQGNQFDKIENLMYIDTLPVFKKNKPIDTAEVVD